jgi:hypothetical protein
MEPDFVVDATFPFTDVMDYALLIKSTGEIIKVYPEKKGEFSLDQLQGYVGGLIEYVESNVRGLELIINEESKMNGSMLNIFASNYYKYKEVDLLFGNVLLIPQKFTK